jgi:hypothetical protein
LCSGRGARGGYAQAEHLDADPAISGNPDEASSSRQSWQQHVREEKRRIQELATERRLDDAQDPVAPLSDEASLAPERALNDITLERGDIVVTEKGAFVFKGQSQEERKPGDFEALQVYSFRQQRNFISNRRSPFFC